MLSLDRFFKNPFDDDDISETELKAFTEDHLGRLTAANHSGEFDGRITDTTAAYTAFFGDVTGDKLQSALQKAATQTMNTRWSDFVAYMTDRGQARVADRAGKKSPLYTQFFPLGLSEIHDVTVANRGTLADRIKQLAVANVAELGQDFADTVSSHVDGFTNARSAQVTAKGENVDAGSERRGSSGELRLQLFDNLLGIAQKHKGDPSAAANYFNQSLLENAQTSSPPAAPPPPTT